MTYPIMKLVAGAGLLGAGTIGAIAHAGGPADFADDFSRAIAQGKASHTLNIDNDSLLLNRNDGFYTSGLLYTQRHMLRDASSLTSFGWRIGQELYTASDIKLPPERVGPPDHPYAAWLFAGVFKETHRTDGTYFRGGVDVGCLGPCAGGEWTQENLHRLLNQPQPKGWSRQVRNEAGIMLYADLAPVRWIAGPTVDITPAVRGRFGNIYTDLAAGVTLRGGRLNNLPGQSTLHGFLRADARAVGYNASLQGGYFSNGNPHTVDPKRLVGEIEAGLAWNDGPYGLRVSIARRSNEIQDLPNSAGSQNYGRLQFSYTP